MKKFYVIAVLALLGISSCVTKSTTEPECVTVNAGELIDSLELDSDTVVVDTIEVPNI